MFDIHEIMISINLPLMQKVNGKWHSRCIVCGDSQKRQNKKRFWIEPSKKNQNYYVAHCYNCGYSNSLSNFLKQYFPTEYKEYFKEKFKSSKSIKSEQSVNDIIDKKTNIKDISIPDNFIKLSDLPDNHIANQYFINRKLPKKFKSYLFFTENFKKGINSVSENYFEYIPEFDTRLVIPSYTHNNNLFMLAGRALNNQKVRYLTAKFDDKYPKVFGIERINRKKAIFIFEGQIDSLFIPNAIAMGGSVSNIKKLESFAPKKQYILVPDIEPRNKQICKYIEKSLQNGYTVSLLPETLKKYGKDINDIIKNSSMTPKQIFDIIIKSKVNGTTGIIKFKQWKRC